jgi:RNA polymerase-binding transcription factor DksA
MRVPTTLASTLTREQHAELHLQLLEQKAFREEQLRDLQRAHPAPDATAGEIADALALAARSALRDVQDALRRMAEGRYGRCVDCGHDLPLVRLEVLPQAARCMACQREAETI